MVAYAYILLGIVCMICFVISPNLDDCTNLTKTCPAVVQWPERGNLYMCPGKRSYVCLMSEENTLREGCIFNFPIPAGTTGCPYTKHCDTLTGQPVLVTPNNYRSCSPDLDGCPSRNHPGYSILDIHKYPLCQGRDTSDERRVAPGATTNSPKRASKHENWTIIGICLGTSFPLLIAVIFFVRKKMNHSPEVLDVSCKDDQIASTKLLDCKSGDSPEVLDKSCYDDDTSNVEFFDCKSGVLDMSCTDDETLSRELLDCKSGDSPLVLDMSCTADETSSRELLDSKSGGSPEVPDDETPTIECLGSKSEDSPEVITMSCKDAQTESTELLDCKSGDSLEEPDDETPSTECMDCKSEVTAQNDSLLSLKLPRRVQYGNNIGGQNPMPFPQYSQIRNAFKLESSNYIAQRFSEEMSEQKKNILLPDDYYRRPISKSNKMHGNKWNEMENMLTPQKPNKIAVSEKVERSILCFKDYYKGLTLMNNEMHGNKRSEVENMLMPLKPNKTENEWFKYTACLDFYSDNTMYRLENEDLRFENSELRATNSRLANELEEMKRLFHIARDAAIPINKETLH